MPRNVELIQKQFGSKLPLPSIELADNALKLGGVEAKLFALKSELSGEVDVMLGNIQEVLDALQAHKDDDYRHLTQSQIDKINSAINAAQALSIANQAINDAKEAIKADAVQSALTYGYQYTDAQLGNVKAELEGKINAMHVDTPEIIDPETGEPTDQNLGEALKENPQNVINPEYFYRFKNMIDNSSFEVFDGTTMIPLGWDNGVVSADASMFETYSLKLLPGQTAGQTPSFQADVNWLKGSYDTDKVVLCFYHKFNPVTVKVYDVVNGEYLELTKLESNLEETEVGNSIRFPLEENWSRFRCMLVFKPSSSTRKVRVEFKGESGSKGACYIDAPSMEPYVQGEYPSIYKAGRYAVSAYQILNPPPADVDRFTALVHFSTTNTTLDEAGHIISQDLVKEDGSLGIKRQCSDFDENGNPGTIVETFYNQDGTINYIDTYTYTYTPTGAIASQSYTTTEVK